MNSSTRKSTNRDRQATIGDSTTQVGRRPVSTVGQLYAIAAFVEATTWVGLLIGMYFKYIPETTELGVQIFGPLHGIAFIAYVVITITAAIVLRWRWGAIILALVAAIPPLVTIPVEMWMRRSGRLSRTIGSRG